MKSHRQLQQIEAVNIITIEDGYLSLNTGNLEIAAGDGGEVQVYNRLNVKGTTKDIWFSDQRIWTTDNILYTPNTITVPSGNFVLNVTDDGNITLQAQSGDITLDTVYGDLTLEGDGAVRLESVASTTYVISYGNAKLQSTDLDVGIYAGEDIIMSSNDAFGLTCTAGAIKLAAGGGPAVPRRVDRLVEVRSPTPTPLRTGMPKLIGC